MLVNVKLVNIDKTEMPFNVTDFIRLFNFEWHSQNQDGNIVMLVLWRDRKKFYWCIS